MVKQFKLICELEDFFLFHNTGIGYAIGHEGLPHKRRFQTGNIRTTEKGELHIDFQSGIVECAEGFYKIKSFCEDPNEHNKIYPNMCKPSFFSTVKKLILP